MRPADEGGAFTWESKGKILPPGAVTGGRDVRPPLEQHLLEAGRVTVCAV